MKMDISDYDFSEDAVERIIDAIEYPAKQNVGHAIELLSSLAETIEDREVSPGYSDKPHPLAVKFKDVADDLGELWELLDSWGR